MKPFNGKVTLRLTHSDGDCSHEWVWELEGDELDYVFERRDVLARKIRKTIYKLKLDMYDEMADAGEVQQ